MQGQNTRLKYGHPCSSSTFLNQAINTTLHLALNTFLNLAPVAALQGLPDATLQRGTTVSQDQFRFENYKLDTASVRELIYREVGFRAF